jgi:hypothetical protein
LASFTKDSAHVLPCLTPAEFALTNHRPILHNNEVISLGALSGQVVPEWLKRESARRTASR